MPTSPWPVGQGNVTIGLTSDVALVLFEWVERQADQDWAKLPDVHPGEVAALTVLAGALQSKLVEPFEADYDRMVEAARQRLADQYGFEVQGGEQGPPVSDP